MLRDKNIKINIVLLTYRFSICAGYFLLARAIISFWVDIYWIPLFLYSASSAQSIVAKKKPQSQVMTKSCHYTFSSGSHVN